MHHIVCSGFDSSISPSSFCRGTSTRSVQLSTTRQKKNSFQCTKCQCYGCTKHTVKNHMHALNAEETITQPHVQNHQIHRPNVHCAEEIILQVTKDAKCTRTCKKTEASQSTKLLIDHSSKESILTIVINSYLSTLTKIKMKCLSFQKLHTHKCSIKINNHLI
jgi:hypothetical protein